MKPQPLTDETAFELGLDHSLADEFGGGLTRAWKTARGTCSAIAWALRTRLTTSTSRGRVRRR